MSRPRPPWLASAAERLRQSLFFVPALCLAAAVLGAMGTLALDRRLADGVLPGWLTSSVADGRALLAAVAAGAITVASVVFSLMLVAVQMASQQFSPRNVRNFLGDRPQQLVLGIVVGTFAYALLVLRSAGSSTQGELSPPVSTLAAVVLAVVALLLSVLFALDRTARGLRVGTIADGVVGELRATIEACRPTLRDGAHPAEVPPEPAVVEEVEAATSGWVQLIDLDRLHDALPEGATARLVVEVGDHVWVGRLVATVDRPLDPERRDRLRSALVVGSARTMQQDLGFGLVRLTDIALRALSPGVNDPHTAEEVLQRLGGVLVAVLEREPPAVTSRRSGSTVVHPGRLGDDEVVRRALEEIRLAARSQPGVAVSLLGVIESVASTLRRHGLDAGRTELERQARLVVEEADVVPSVRPRLQGARDAALEVWQPG